MTSGPRLSLKRKLARVFVLKALHDVKSHGVGTYGILLGDVSHGDL